MSDAFEETVLASDTGTVTVRRMHGCYEDGAEHPTYLIGLAHGNRPEAEPDVVIELTGRQRATLIDELRDWWTDEHTQARLTQQAARIATLEAERDQARAERDSLREIVEAKRAIDPFARLVAAIEQMAMKTLIEEEEGNGI